MLPKAEQDIENKKESERELSQTKIPPQTHKVNKSVNLTVSKAEVNAKRASSQEKSKDRSLSKSGKKKLYPDEKKLFSTTDLKKLSQLLSKQDLEKYEKKFDYADHKGFSLERKYQSDFKVYNKKYSELEEQLEFITLQLKEALLIRYISYYRL